MGHMGLSTRRSPLQLHNLDISLQPILWPTELKLPPPVDRLAGLGWSIPTDTLFFTQLNYDVRRVIYDIMLADIGTQQHIFCPSITRSTQARELFSQYLVSKKCDGPSFKATLACGHWDCDRAKAGDDGETASEYRMADLIALMGTCKFGYLEVSQYVYRSITFTFSTFPAMGAFIDRTPLSVIEKIRSVAFIAHILPQNSKACQRFINDGEYFQTEDQDAIALFKRFCGLELLEVNFFPSLILAQETCMSKVVKPLDQLCDVPGLNVVVRVPNMCYGVATEVGLPLASRLSSSGRFAVQRPVVVANQAKLVCKGYTYGGRS